MPNEKILIVEDEESILEAVRYSLHRDGYQVITAQDGLTGLSLSRDESPDLMILDIMLPNLDGIEVCKEIRKNSSIPIIMLTAKGEEIDKIIGLEIGADDYMTKPFSMRELIARIKALLRRSGIKPNTSSSQVSHTAYTSSSGLNLNIDTHIATLNDVPLQLRPKEFELLSYFMKHPGLALTRDQILQDIWGYDYIADTSTVDVHVRWLREKIENTPANPETILTIRGTGYRFIT